MTGGLGSGEVQTSKEPHRGSVHNVTPTPTGSIEEIEMDAGTPGHKRKYHCLPGADDATIAETTIRQPKAPKQMELTHFDTQGYCEPIWDIPQGHLSSQNIISLDRETDNKLMVGLSASGRR